MSRTFQALFMNPAPQPTNSTSSNSLCFCPRLSRLILHSGVKGSEEIFQTQALRSKIPARRACNSAISSCGRLWELIMIAQVADSLLNCICLGSILLFYSRFIVQHSDTYTPKINLNSKTATYFCHVMRLVVNKRCRIHCSTSSLQY